MNELLTLLTIAEVSRLWQKNRTSVLVAMGARKRALEYRKTGWVYLITYNSCVRRWGKPIHPDKL